MESWWRRMVDYTVSKFQPTSENETDSADTEPPMDEDVRHAMRRNSHWREELEWDLSTIVDLVGEQAVTVESVSFVRAVKKWQRRNGLEEDGIVGPNTWEKMVDASLDPWDRAVRKIMEPTIGKESSGRYWAVNRDEEFKGSFKNHRAEGRVHIGLSFGILQFTQDGGMLGKLLKKFAKTNQRKFTDIMGSTWPALIAITNRSGRSGLLQARDMDQDKLLENPLRGSRVKKVPVIVNGVREERDLWEEPWVSRFIRLGHVTEFQKEQRKLAEEEYLRPILEKISSEGLLSEKMVAAAFSGAIHRGAPGMSDFFDRCISSDEPDDRDVLKEMVRRDPKRFSSFLEDDSLSWKTWSGWDHI